MKRQHAMSEAGFSLVDMIVVCVLIGIIGAMAIPSITSSLDGLRLGQAARNVEREMQTAKQRAVSKGRVMRIHFNCPGNGQFRMVELLGSPRIPKTADNNFTARCSELTYPYPAPDNNPITVPNLDGPIQRLDSQITFGAAQSLEFWPDGTAHFNNGNTPWGLIPVAGITVSVSRNSHTQPITVNGLGKVQLQPQQ
jgi:type II secretory pathway pseudopilin PulG